MENEDEDDSEEEDEDDEIPNEMNKFLVPDEYLSEDEGAVV